MRLPPSEMEGAEDSDSEGQADHIAETKVGTGDHVETEETTAAAGKKTKGRVKIKMEFIDNKLRRYTTFSKRKTGIMKKAYELSTLTGTQVMLLVASETGHVYTFATKKLQPMITSEEGKSLIQTCLNSPDPPSSTKGQQIDQRMSATGFEEPDLTYTLPTAATSSSAPPPPPPVLNAGDGSARTGGVDVKVASPSTNPASPDDRRPPLNDGGSFYNGERNREASPEFDARRSRPRSPSEHARPHFYHESHRPRSPYRSDSPKYHTITPRSADRRFGRDPALRERSRSASPQHGRKYGNSADPSSRHSSGNNRHNSPPPSLHYNHHSSRHGSPPPLPPPSHHHYHLPPGLPPAPPLPGSSSSSSRPARSSRSRSRSPVSPPLSGDGETSWHRRRQQISPPPPNPPLMTTVNTHNKIMNASYHPKSPRAGMNLSEGVKPGANFISTSALAMQLPNGTLISPGSLPPGIALTPLPPRGHTYLKLASGQSYVPASTHSESPTSRSPARSPMNNHSASDKEINASSRPRNSRQDTRENNGRDRSSSPGWEETDRAELRQTERPSDTPPPPPPPTSIVPPGFVLSSNYLLPVTQLSGSSSGTKPAALVYPPASSLPSSENSSQPITHLPDGAQYILNIPGLQTATRSSDAGVGQGDAAPGPHFIAIQVPVAAQQPTKAPKLRQT